MIQSESDLYSLLCRSNCPCCYYLFRCVETTNFPHKLQAPTATTVITR